MKNASQIDMPPTMRGALELLGRLDPLRHVLDETYGRVKGRKDDSNVSYVQNALDCLERAMDALSCIVGDQSRDVSADPRTPMNGDRIVALLIGEDAIAPPAGVTLDQHGRPIKIGSIIETDFDDVGIVTHVDGDVVVFQPLDPDEVRNSYSGDQMRVLRESLVELTSKQ